MEIVNNNISAEEIIISLNPSPPSPQGKPIKKISSHGSKTPGISLYRT